MRRCDLERLTPSIHFNCRADTADVRLPDKAISRSHAVLSARDGSWILSNLATGNPVKLNGAPLSGDAVLAAGDVICFAGNERDWEFIFRVPADDDATVQARHSF